MSGPNRITRRVIWQPHCGRCGWTGPERDAKWHAAVDLAGHETDRHGGAERGEP